MQQKTPSGIGERLDRQADAKNYSECLSISCLTKASPNPTTGVAEMGLRLALVSEQEIELIDIGQYSTMPAK